MINPQLDVIRVMIVDDHRTMRMIIRDLLKSCGITEVTEAGDGKQALEAIENAQCPPDVVICDLHMDGMDGLEFCQKVRMSKHNKTKDIKVIILTGDKDTLVHEICKQVGALAILTKPVSFEVLGNEICEAVGFGKQEIEGHQQEKLVAAQ